MVACYIKSSLLLEDSDPQFIVNSTWNKLKAQIWLCLVLDSTCCLSYSNVHQSSILIVYFTLSGLSIYSQVLIQYKVLGYSGGLDKDRSLSETTPSFGIFASFLSSVVARWSIIKAIFRLCCRESPLYQETFAIRLGNCPGLFSRRRWCKTPSFS